MATQIDPAAGCTPTVSGMLALDRIDICRGLYEPSLGRLAAQRLAHALAFPPMHALGRSAEGIVVHIEIIDVSRGCHYIRSSTLAALLGFGNARLRYRAQVRDLRSDKPLLAFSDALRHSGLSRGSVDYLTDNGLTLVSELCVLAARRLEARIRKSAHHSRFLPRLTKRILSSLRLS
ncbi:MAG: hypothetical protein AAF417_19470 [Pseudomonadota bacterium]